MLESYLSVGDDLIFVRHNSISPERLTLLFVHGLGDSSLSFAEAFEDGRLDKFSLVAPDLVGCGRSSVAADGDYSFDAQVRRLWMLVERLELERFVVVGHSMGGDITTLLCASDERGAIAGYVNIEGDITQHDLFISGDAVRAAERGEFERWFCEEFLEKTVYEVWGGALASARRYYASLRFCRPEVFLASARELFARNNALSGRFKSEIGEVYCSLSIPKVFCYGTESLSAETLAFLEDRGLERRAFVGAHHAVMIDAADEFYSFLREFASAV